MERKEFEDIFSGKNLKSRDGVSVVDSRSIYFGDPTNTQLNGVLS